MKSLIIKNAILLTSTVNINTTNLSITNNEERLSQYLSAIKFYLTNIDKFNYLVICDNSNFNYNSIEELRFLIKGIEDQIEFLYFQSESSFLQKGKGFGEGETIKYAFQNSKYLKECNTVIKITGRIIIKNIGEIIFNRNFSNKILCVPYSFKYLFLKFVNLGFDTRIISIPTETYSQSLLNSFEEVDDNRKKYLEIVLMEDIKRKKINWQYFQNYPIYMGISGSTGKRYNETKITIIIKNIILYILNLQKKNG
jgi:hypothetical protein